MHQSLPALFFFKVETSLHTLIQFKPGSVHSGSASWGDYGWTLAQIKPCILTWGWMYIEWIAPSIVFFFHQAYTLQKSACMVHAQDYTAGLNLFIVMHPFCSCSAAWTPDKKKKRLLWCCYQQRLLLRRKWTALWTDTIPLSPLITTH